MSGWLKKLAGYAFRRGMARRSNAWLAFAAVAGVMGWLRRKAEEPPKVVHSEVLEPGERITISVFEPPR